MAKRFKTSPVPSGEVASYTSDPYNLSSVYMFGSSSPFTGTGNTIVRPSDDLLISKGGNRALSVYQRLLNDEQVQSCFSKLLQEVTSRPWYVEEYSDKPGDLAVRDFVAEVLEEIDVDNIYKGLGEALIMGFSVGEVMWKKTKRGVVPYDFRMRDQRRFVFQESEESQTGFTMRCLTFNRMFEGVELPARKFIVNRFWAYHNGDPYGSALGRILYPLVKFRRRAIESYVLYGDRYATPTAVATAPLSASTKELEGLYSLLSNLSQETAIILPDGYQLDFANPSGSPDVFKNLIDYIDKEISVLICGENEAGQAEAGSRASSQVANLVRIVKASELSETISQVLTQSLVRWIVDLNFGVDVAAPTISREFRIEESTITVPDLSLLIQSGFRPKKEWVERHFKVELEDEEPGGPEGEEDGGKVTYDPEQDANLFENTFGPNAEAAPAESPPEVSTEGETAPAEGTPEVSTEGETAPAEGEPSLEDFLNEETFPENEKTPAEGETVPAQESSDTLSGEEPWMQDLFGTENETEPSEEVSESPGEENEASKLALKDLFGDEEETPETEGKT